MSSKSAWSAKRQRQYVHVKKSLVAAGKPVPLPQAEAMAVAVVAAAAPPDTVLPSPEPVEEGPR